MAKKRKATRRQKARERKMCEGKVRHATWYAARQARDRLHDYMLTVYRCAFCGYYHVGHRRPPLKNSRWH